MSTRHHRAPPVNQSTDFIRLIKNKNGNGVDKGKDENIEKIYLYVTIERKINSEIIIHFEVILLENLNSLK